MGYPRFSRFAVLMLLASAASAPLLACGSAWAGNYDAESVLMSPGTDGTGVDTVRVAQADVNKAAENQTAPAAIPTKPPYTKTNKDQPVQAVMPEEKPKTSAATPAPAAKKQSSPVDYAANTVDYDQKNRIVTLSGHVELTQEGRKLEADKVIYNLRDDIATAEGHVVIRDTNGDVHHAESVELSDKMRKGLVNSLFTTLADGSRIWAREGIKESETRYRMKDATYTACVACADNPQSRPPWALHAKDVELRKDEHRVVYHNAWLDMGGVPVFYTPYFSHPDGSVEQKSGFLTPSFGYNSELGGFFSQPYYWAISPDMDTTFSLMPTTRQGPLLRNNFRKRWEDAYLETDASITNSSRTDSVGGVAVDKNDKVRGHFFGKGGWDINRYWRARANINLTSDEQYLRQYGFSDDSILDNDVYAEYFNDRDYAIIKGEAFQDIRTDKSDQPNILPYAEYEKMGEPNALLGGRWSWDSSSLSLARDGNGQDMWRLSTRAAWDRRDIASFGLVLDTELGARADGYTVTNSTAHTLNPAEDENQQLGRFIPNAQFTASYPMQRAFQKFQLRVEPVATLYMAPDINNDDSIPNEDSQDVQLDAGNILEGDRFTGLDRVEDQSHVAYGLKTGLYDYEGGRLTTFLGQSYNFFGNADNPFPNGSGLETRSSDYVGAVNASFDGGRHNVSYRFQVDSDTLASQRHELYAQTEWGPVEADGYYLYAAGAPGTEYPDSREQIRLGSTIDLSDQWSFRGDAIYDLSNVSTERGLRRSIFTLNYEHECYNVALTADRYLADQSSGVQDTTIMFRIGLKNLGEYQTKAFGLSSGGGSNN
jgi:LPS-assembly protein